MALIDLSKAFLQSATLSDNHQVIFAIDEPEVSLHTSSCFEQFEKLKAISNSGVQTLLTTHWYGFMPILSDGTAIYIAEVGEDKICKPIDLRCFLDELKRLKQNTKGQLPKEIELKSSNDLVQSIVASITSNDSNWVICEGSSDKIYLEKYINTTKKSYILPIGKSSNVKKIFKYLYLALSDEKSSIQGKVFMLLDTDRSFELFQKDGNLKGIEIKRLQNNLKTKKTTLLNTSDNNFYPPTEIEDTLESKAFLKTLSFFNDNGYADSLSELLEDLEIKYTEAASGLAFDLRESQKELLDNFFKLGNLRISPAI